MSSKMLLPPVIKLLKLLETTITLNSSTVFKTNLLFKKLKDALNAIANKSDYLTLFQELAQLQITQH